MLNSNIKINSEFILPFKGKRTYVHGSDIISSIESIFPNNVKIFKINFTDIIKKNVIKIIKPQKDIINVKAKFSINEIDYHIIEIDKNISITNIPYNEYLATEGYILSNKTIKLKKKNNFSNIEIIIALNKILLENIFNLRDFWFVNLESALFPLSFSEVELKYNKSLFNKFHETEIYMDYNFVGHIRFQNIS